MAETTNLKPSTLPAKEHHPSNQPAHTLIQEGLLCIPGNKWHVPDMHWQPFKADNSSITGMSSLQVYKGQAVGPRLHG